MLERHHIQDQHKRHEQQELTTKDVRGSHSICILDLHFSHTILINNLDFVLPWTDHQTLRDLINTPLQGFDTFFESGIRVVVSVSGMRQSIRLAKGQRTYRLRPTDMEATLL